MGKQATKTVKALTGYMPAEEFVRIWQTSSNRDEVAEKCGRCVGTIYRRAKRYRKVGVPLKRFVGRFQPREVLDIPTLIALAEKLAKTGKES